MNLSTIFKSIFILVLISSCSKDNESVEEKKEQEKNVTKIITRQNTPNLDRPTFSKLTTDRKNAFVNEEIILEINGKNFTDLKINSNNENLITKLSSTSYSIKGLKAEEDLITIQLIKGSEIKTRTTKINFFEHGVSNDFKIVEGIRVGVDKSIKIVELHGEPTAIFKGNGGIFWLYFSKGLIFSIGNNIQAIVVLDDTATATTEEGITKQFSIYPYKIANLRKAEINLSIPVKFIIDILGNPKENPNGIVNNNPLFPDEIERHFFTYENPNIRFGYEANNPFNFEDKDVTDILLY